MILFRKYHTSSSVHSIIGDIRMDSLPLMQRTSLSLFTENSSSLILRLVLRCTSLHSSNSSRLPLNFFFEVSTSFLLARLELSALRMPISVTFPAPAISLKSAQHQRNVLVGRIFCSNALVYMLTLGLWQITEGYWVLTNLTTSAGSMLVKLMCV